MFATLLLLVVLLITWTLWLVVLVVATLLLLVVLLLTWTASAAGNVESVVLLVSKVLMCCLMNVDETDEVRSVTPWKRMRLAFSDPPMALKK